MFVLVPLFKIWCLSSQTPKHGILNILHVFKHQHPLYSLINYLSHTILNSLLNEHTNLCQWSRSLPGLVLQSVINIPNLDLILGNPSPPFKFNTNATSSIEDSLILYLQSEQICLYLGLLTKQFNSSFSNYFIFLWVLAVYMETFLIGSV